jgi:hypothetical protein
MHTRIKFRQLKKSTSYIIKYHTEETSKNNVTYTEWSIYHLCRTIIRLIEKIKG